MSNLEGKFRARATDVQLGTTKSGADTIGVAFELLDHPNMYVTWYGYFTEKTTERTFDSLRYCGWTGDDLSDLSGITNNEVEIVIEQETYEGKTRAKVQWVNRAASTKAQVSNVMSDEQKRAFSARMKGAALASKSRVGIVNNPVQPSAPKSTANGGVAPGAGADDDEIPF